MSIVRTFNGATLLKPGAYTKIVVENLSGFPLQATGVVGIIGEAKGGAPGVLDILSQNNIQSAKARYKSGPIADALELLVNPSKDPRIANGASTIIIYKTNHGTQSAANLLNQAAVAKMALVSKNYGGDENNIAASVAIGSLPDLDPTILGTIMGPYNLAGGETLLLNIDGTAYTYTGTLTGASVTAAALVVDLNTSGSWSPSKPVVASVVGGAVQIVVDTTAIPSAAKEYGYIKVDPASTLDTIVGITGSVRGAKGSRIVTFKKDLLVEQMLDVGGIPQLSIQYIGTGSAAALSIAKISGVLTMTSVITGAAGDNLNIALEDAAGHATLTLQQLSDLIGSGGKYTCSMVGPNGAAQSNILDCYTSIACKDMAAPLAADGNAVVGAINTTSSLVQATRLFVPGPLAVTASPVFFTGASDGVSANSDFAAGFEAFKEERINVVVPLISSDSGALTIDSINALAANHAAWGWSTTGRSERHAFVSKYGSKAQIKAAARTLNLGYCSLVAEHTTVLNRLGNLVDLEPWSFACICAGLRAGAEVGEPLTFKNINVNNLFVKNGDWNPRKDYNEMIDAGVLIGESVDSGGFRIVLGNTTYGIDPSFVWNRESVVQAAGYVAYDLRFNLELTFTGTKAKTGSAEAIANFIKARMTAYLGADIIVGDDLNKKLGYKNLNVLLQGNTAIINISVTPVQGIDFILPTIYLADISQSA